MCGVGNARSLATALLPDHHPGRTGLRSAPGGPRVASLTLGSGWPYISFRYIHPIYRSGTTRHSGSVPGEGSSMLELAILGLLKERSMHGYQLSKRLSDTLGGFWRVSYGSLYPTLQRLERQGAVEREFSTEEV